MGDARRARERHQPRLLPRRAKPGHALQAGRQLHRAQRTDHRPHADEALRRPKGAGRRRRLAGQPARLVVRHRAKHRRGRRLLGQHDLEGKHMSAFTIRQDSCAFDFLSLGALVHRLDSGVIPFRKARSVDIHVSGGEYNVAANLSDCFGFRTGIATAMVKYPIGELVQARVRETGVTPFYKWFEHDGVRGPNIATVYSDRGYGVRPPIVFYNRSNEAGALLKPGDFDWKAIFGKGVCWFHSGGIFASLSETTAEVIIEGMKAAKAAGAITSFDLNYRAKLWASVGGPQKGVETIRKIVEHVDALVGNEEDLQMGLGLEGQDVHSKSKLDPEGF